MAQLDKQALEAIQSDVLTFTKLYLNFTKHPNSNLLILGLIPASSMYIYETHHAMLRLFSESEARKLPSYQFPENLVESRHRAKLLSSQSITETTAELEAIALKHWEYFIKPHVGRAKWILNLATDLGIYVHADCIFSTTHMLTFSSKVVDVDTVRKESHELGLIHSSYTIELLNIFGLNEPKLASTHIQSEAFEMRDIKANALYQRASFETVPRGLSMALTVLLANLNYIRCVLPPFLVDNAQTRLKLKFVVAYHADANLRAIQNSLYTSGQLPTEEVKAVFKNMFSNEDSKWLKKQSQLRNLFVHYLLPDDIHVRTLLLNMTRNEVIELLAERPIEEIELLLDRHIERLAEALEQGFDLKGDPFFYGRVT